MAKSVEGLASRVEAQEQSAKKLAKAVGGTVASDGDADPENVVQLRNSGGTVSGEDLPLIDTAYRAAK